ncbi:MAG TPA: hypothetical protein VK001_03255 [Geminicoccaceae bacterium]|nr:hypothetical protein [Geminicoccaceae bacterium]
MRVSALLPIAVLAGLLLFGCSPRYQTFTSYTPPADEAGRQCLLQCSSLRQTCRRDGEPRIEQCRREAQTAAHLETVRRAAAYTIDLERYGNEGYGAPELPGPASPDYARCDAEAADVEYRCRADYDLCYQNCGGRVEYTTHCVANCD